MMHDSIEIPVVLFVFRRLDTVKLILDKIRQIKPKKFYVFSDGPREGKEEEQKRVLEVREYIKSAVDWECDVWYEFSQKNKGCAANICEGINRVFEKEDSAIILEDDALPLKEFFFYCQYLLKKYENDKRIQYIAGFNAVGDSDTIRCSYSFSKSAPMSGAIATWADRWKGCDFKMKNWPRNRSENRFREYFYSGESYRLHCRAFEDSYKGINDGWDYQFYHDLLDRDRFAIVPKGNLVKSYGYTQGAFHPQSKRQARSLEKIMNYTGRDFPFPMEDAADVALNREYDILRQKYLLGVNGNYLQRHLYYTGRKIKDLAYRYMPSALWKGLKKMIKK